MSVLHWNQLLLDQLVMHWDHQLRPRLDGLTDDEHRWQPAGDDVTTIAWRLDHIIGALEQRTHDHFGGPDPGTTPDAGNAGAALARLDAAYGRWVDGVRSLGDDGLADPCGPSEGPYAREPLAALVTHIHREVIHHGTEIALLRDLYSSATFSRPDPTAHQRGS